MELRDDSEEDSVFTKLPQFCICKKKPKTHRYFNFPCRGTSVCICKKQGYHWAPKRNTAPVQHTHADVTSICGVCVLTRIVTACAQFMATAELCR